MELEAAAAAERRTAGGGSRRTGLTLGGTEVRTVFEGIYLLACPVHIGKESVFSFAVLFFNTVPLGKIKACKRHRSYRQKKANVWRTLLTFPQNHTNKNKWKGI